MSGAASVTVPINLISDLEAQVSATQAASPESDSTPLVALETAVDKNSKASLNGYVVFCSDSDKLEGKLKDLAEKAKLKNVVLAIESAEGPEKYGISKDADVTVLLYKERVVTANYTFGKGKLTEKDIEKVNADIAKLVK